MSLKTLISQIQTQDVFIRVSLGTLKSQMVVMELPFLIAEVPFFMADPLNPTRIRCNNSNTLMITTLVILIITMPK